MPEYSFQCPQCGATFNRQMSISADHSHASCPNCHKNAHRHYTAPGITFKGSGFYVTDSKKKPKTA
ncbi:MAG TPA: FmdB family zinc ribbon protein [Anaerolineales bacterium]|nr:FmdB family zinc ribbon protein [Anaerolineales bacterium]